MNAFIIYWICLLYTSLGINMVLGHSEMLSEIGNDVRPLAFAFCSIMVLYLVGMADDPVSYTHLDVYKRQSHGQSGNHSGTGQTI